MRKDIVNTPADTCNASENPKYTFSFRQLANRVKLNTFVLL